MPLDAIVVLGCRVGSQGIPAGAARQRVERAAEAYVETSAKLVIASGGKRWHGTAEAEAFGRELLRLGVPNDRVVGEYVSHNTRENARHSAALLREHGATQVGIVTSDWHMERALSAFEHFGVVATPLPAATSAAEQRRRYLGERCKELFDRLLLTWSAGGFARYLGMMLALLLVLSLGCGKDAPKTLAKAGASAGASASSVGSADARIATLLLAEDQRRPAASVSEALIAHEPRLREYAARALARSADVSAVEPLLAALGDESSSVVTWAAFGLGRACAARENDVVRALVLRATTLLTDAAALAQGGRALSAMAQALGRCATDEAERSLRAWLKLDPALAEEAALALGQLAARRGRLDDTTYLALLDAAERDQPPRVNALSAFARLAPPRGALNERLVEVASKVAARGGPSRAFAIRALGRAAAVTPLARVSEDPALPPGELAEVARELARLGEAGQPALSQLVVRLVPEGDQLATLPAAKELGALLATLDGLDRPRDEARAALTRLAALPVNDGDEPARKRRSILLRCAASRVLAAGVWNEPGLRSCDPTPARSQGKLSQLALLDRGKLEGARGEAVGALVTDADPAVRKAALRLIPAHRELRTVPAWLAAALTDPAPGVVATAAELVAAHPDRALAAGGRAAGDTSGNPDPSVAGALGRALRAASKQNIGLMTALIDAAGALGALDSLSELETSCKSDQPTLREHAERALRALGQEKRRCAPPAAADPPARELAHLVTKPVKLLFTTEIGELTLELEPNEAPVAVTRVVELARSGFYDGTTIHRVAPGFVAQLGDPGGDGYGVAKLPPLRSELGPTPLEAGALAMAQGGVDSASSQFFVTLGRFPHLDGESARLGRAGPGWDRLVAGDRVLRVRVEE